MKTSYSYVVLRYAHDVVSGEFVNVGVALYAPGAKYIGCLCNTRYTRLNKMFLNVDGDYFRSLVKYIETRFEEIGDKLRSELPLNGIPKNIVEIAKSILPQDDSSLQWSEAGGGKTDDPAKTLEELFSRFVERYEERQQRPRREDGDVWRVFKKELETRHVLSHLSTKRIIAQNYEYEFQHAWKNQKWHLYEPVSFDLQEADSILDKANRWLGRAVTLQDAPETFKLHLLLGEPTVESLRVAYTKAENILNKMPVEKEFVRERDVEKFSVELASEIAAHDDKR
jgi:hypothetical protein